MAVLQKIRERNVLLVSIIALALLLFILSMSERSCTDTAASMTAGEIDGEELNLQEFQDLVQNYQFMYESTNPNAQLNSDEAQNQIHDQAWNAYLLNKLIAKECEEIGLSVTDDEVNKVLTTDGVIQNGQVSQFLRLPYFMNSETMAYDPTSFSTIATELENLKSNGQLTDDAAKLYKYMAFVKQQIKNEILANKYNALLVNGMISNPVEAKHNFAMRTAEKEVLLVSVPYSTVDDAKVKVTDAEVDARFKADKAKYVSMSEVRDAKVIDVFVKPSDQDKKEIEADFKKYFAELDSAKDNKAINLAVRNSSSDIPYSKVLKSAKGFPTYVASMLEGTDSLSLALGQTSKPQFDQINNKYYIAKLIDKQMQVDSVLHRDMMVIGADDKEKATRADSIMNALNAGGSFKAIAQKYNQSGDSAWIATSQYENSRIDSEDDVMYLNTLYTGGVGTHKLQLQNGNILIVQVMETRNPIMKYNVAVIDKTFNFSERTYNDTFNKFSSFIASNKTIADIEKNAEKSGYTVQSITVPSNQHSVAGVQNTRDALKWLYDEAKVGDLSEIYRCGSNDHLMLVSLAGVSEDTYSEKLVKEHIKEVLTNEKKAEEILKSCGKVKSIEAAAKVAGALTDTLSNVTAMMPVQVPATQTSEPLVGVIAAKTANGAFAGPFKGVGGVYMLKVLGATDPKGKEVYEEKAEKEQVANQNMSTAMRTMQLSLMKKYKVKDLRYKFSM